MKRNVKIAIAAIILHIFLLSLSILAMIAKGYSLNLDLIIECNIMILGTYGFCAFVIVIANSLFDWIEKE